MNGSAYHHGALPTMDPTIHGSAMLLKPVSVQRSILVLCYETSRPDDVLVRFFSAVCPVDSSPIHCLRLGKTPPPFLRLPPSAHGQSFPLDLSLFNGPSH